MGEGEGFIGLSQRKIERRRDREKGEKRKSSEDGKREIKERWQEGRKEGERDSTCE